jgi:hypothetical protein
MDTRAGWIGNAKKYGIKPVQNAQISGISIAKAAYCPRIQRFFSQSAAWHGI